MVFMVFMGPVLWHSRKSARAAGPCTGKRQQKTRRGIWPGLLHTYQSYAFLHESRFVSREFYRRQQSTCEAHDAVELAGGFRSSFQERRHSGHAGTHTWCRERTLVRQEDDTPFRLRASLM
jgi:hypothetical protein